MWRVPSRPGARIAVLEAGLACCALEVEAALARGLLEQFEGAPESGPAVLVVAGTMTHALAPAVAHRFAELSGSGPVRVLSFGACSTSGGPYWDAPTVCNGVGELLPVSSYVPGCPPRPEALVAELERLVDEMAEEGSPNGVRT